MIVGLRGSPLEPRDLAGLLARWITPEMAEQAGIRRVCSIDGAATVGRNGAGNWSGLLIPNILPGEDCVREFRLRRDHPDFEVRADGSKREIGKYQSPPGRANLLFFPVGVTPEMLTDVRLPVLITEGEFKSMALWRLAQFKTEWPRFLPIGISGVWNWRGTVGKTYDATGVRVDEKGVISDFSRLLLEQRLVLTLFDSDIESKDEVRAAQAMLSKALRERHASVRQFNWPEDRPPGAKGVDDLLASVGPDHVLTLIEAAMNSTETQSNAKPVVFTYADVPCVWDYEDTVEYVIPGLVPQGAITLFTGDSGCGKSIFATAMAGAIASGGTFLGHQCAKRKVLYLDRENPLALVKQHLFDLHIERTPDLIYWGGWCEQSADGPAAVSLHEFAKAEKPVMVFDSLISFHDGDEKDASETRRYLQRFRDLADAGATIIPLHHTGKSENSKQYRGSSDIKASIDMGWLIEKLGDDPAGLLTDLLLKPFKNRIGAGTVIPLSFQDGKFVMNTMRPETNREIFERIVRLHPNSTGAELVKVGKAAGLGKTRIESLLMEGTRDGWLNVTLGKRNARYYSLAE